MADQLGPAIHNTGLLTSMAQQNRRLEANQAELKNKNAELEESEARLDSIIAIVPDIIYRLDRDGKITFISDAISRYDYHPEEMVGRHYLDLVCEEDEDKATWRMNERRTGDRSTKALEIRLRPSKNNNKTDVGSNHTPVLLISADGSTPRLKLARNPGAAPRALPGILRITNYWRSSYSRHTKWRPSDSLPGALPTTSTTCSWPSSLPAIS